MIQVEPVVVEDIAKSYGDVKALSGVSFAVRSGEIFGIIGPDGAGKTTLFRILATLLLADRGSVRVDGYDVVTGYKDIRSRVGYMPGRFSLYQDMTVEENLKFFAALFGTTIRENYHLIEDIYSHIEPFKDRRAGNLSGGMKQKLALCCALVHKPGVLYLDEPTTGVDPVSRKEFWEMLHRLKKQGITILVSTPYMDEAMLCDRIALIRGGRFMSIETPQNIVAQFDTQLWSARARSMFRLLGDLRAYPGMGDCYVAGETHHFTLSGTEFDPAALVEWLRAKGHEDIAVERIEPDIEDCYMRIAGK